MKKIKITTPENIEIEYILADVGSRGAAAIIDALVLAALMLALGIGVVLIWRFAPGFWREYYGWVIGIALILNALLNFGYYIFMELTMNGKTLGKKVLKLRTIRNNGQPLTLKHSALRNLFRLFVDSFGIGVVMIFFTKQHRRVGDFVASTIVVHEDNKTRPITLDSLERVNENFNYYLSNEERELLREYFERRESMEDFSELRESIKLHFRKKFEELGILDKWESFIEDI